jgi:hypothetical protein
MKKLRNPKCQKGVSAIEFAIVLPLLLLLVFGMVEFSVLLYDKAVITNASREGARAGIVFSDPRIDDTVIEGVVNNYCGSHLISFDSGSVLDVNILPEWPGRAGSSSGDDLRVQVSYHYDFLVLPAFMADLAGGIDLRAETVMRME